MEIINLYPGSFGSNCYVLLSDGRAAVVDPSANAQTILEEIEARGAVLDLILLTHGHFDHILSLDELREASGAPAYIHESDADMPGDPHKNAFYHFFGQMRTFGPPEYTLRDGETLMLGKTVIRTVHTPGHTKGSVCYLCGEELLLTGDTLFDGSFGRFDLYGGNAETLFASLASLRSLPSRLTIYPGHGNDTLLGDALDRLIP